MKVNPQDTRVRQALLKAHNNKCCYTNQDLYFPDFQLDHIIPKSLQGDPERLLELLNELQILPEEFEFDSIYNLLPVKSSANRKKSDKVLPIKSLHYYRAIAIDAAPAVREKMEKYKVRIEYGKQVESIKATVVSGERTVEEVLEDLTGEPKYFEEERKVDRDSQPSNYLYSTRNVRLEGNLPTFPELTGNCTLLFRSVKIRGCRITIDHQEIVSRLFDGLRTPPSLRLRGFIDDRANSDPGYFQVILGNSIIQLAWEEVEQLCDIVDDFADHYIQNFQEIEVHYGVYPFQKSLGHQLGYQLVRVKRDLWAKMIEFVYEFDFEKGQSEWHIFDASRGFINVLSARESETLDEGYHALFRPEQVENYMFDHPDDEVWLVWEPFVVDDEGPEVLNERQQWNAEMSYRWLTQEFIPYVLYYNSSEQGRGGLFEDFRVGFDLEEYGIDSGRIRQEIDLNCIETVDELYNLIELMQSFYYVPIRMLMLTKLELKGLYAAAELCLKRTPVVKGLDYLASKLRISKGDSWAEILVGIEKLKHNAQDQVIRSSVIDGVLSAMYWILDCRRHESNLNRTEIRTIVKNLEPFWEKQKVFETLMRSY